MKKVLLLCFFFLAAAFLVNAQYCPNNNSWRTITAYSPQSGQWTANPFKCVSGFVFTIGNVAYIGGGHDASYSNTYASPNFFAYDASLGQWSGKATLPVGVRDGKGFSINGKGYYIGGRQNLDFANVCGTPNVFYRYDPETNAWTYLGHLLNNTNLKQAAQSVVFVIDGKAYITYGYQCNNGSVTWNTKTYVFNPVNETLVDANMPYPADFPFRAGANAQETIDNKGWMFNAGNFIRFDPNATSSTERWKKFGGQPNFVCASWYQSSFAVGGYFYVGNGIYDQGPGGACTEWMQWDPAISPYTNVTKYYNNCITARYRALGFNIANKGYVVGGSGGYYQGWSADVPLIEYTTENAGSQKTIFTDRNVSNSLCQGSTFNVAYSGTRASVYDNYQGCNDNYASGNIFKVELSDINGNFGGSNPRYIGSNTSITHNGTISASIPSDLSPGSRYKIRVVSTNPAAVGFDNGRYISIAATPSTAGSISHPYSVPYPAEKVPDSIKSVSILVSPTVSSYTWQRSFDQSNWQTAPGVSNVAQYILPAADSVNVFYRRMSNLSCGSTVSSNIIPLKVFGRFPYNVNKLQGKISGQVVSANGTGVTGITITAQKQTNLLGSPQSKTYTATTIDDGSYFIPYIFYGDATAGDASSVTFNVTASKTGHTFENATLTAVLSDANKEAIKNFKDLSTYSVSGKVTQNCPDCDVLFRDDSINDVQIKVTQNGNIMPGGTTGGLSGNGRYGITFNNPGNYKLIPLRAGHSFSPAQTDMSITNSNVAGVNFVDTAKYTISGSIKGGCNEFIGTATLIFTDTVASNPFRFKRTVTTNADGSFSIKLPARKYKVKVESYTFGGSGATITQETIKNWFNVINKDSLLIDIDTSSKVLNLVYNRPPVMVLENLPDTSCGSYAVFKQGEPRSFKIKVYEGDPGNGCLMSYDSVSKVKLITNVHAESEYKNLFCGTLNGVANITLIGGSPNIVAPHEKHFEAQFTDRYGRVAAGLSKEVKVLGLAADTGTFTTVSPDVPILILHAPPGDQSISYWEQNKTSETAMRFSASTDKSLGAFAEVNLGTKFSAGIGFTTETEIWANINTSMSNTSRVTNNREAIIGSTTSVGYSTSPNGGDVYVGGAMNLCYAVSHEIKYRTDTTVGCILGMKNSLAIAPKGFATTYTYSEGQITDVVIPTLRLFGDNSPDSASYYSNQIKVWEQVIANNKANIERATFDKNRSFDGSAGPITESTTSSSTQSSSLEFDVEIDRSIAINAGLNIGGTGFSGGVNIGLKMSSGNSETNTSTVETKIGYVLDDDDAGDYYSVDIKKDPVYNTPVFALIAGTSSCPAEPIAQDRDRCQLAIPITVKRNLDPTIEATFALRLQNTSESRETRTYLLSFNQATNPDGAIVSIGGSPVTSNISYSIPYLGTQVVTVSVKKTPSSQIFAYEGLEFTLSDGCDGGVSTSNSISAFFESPCNDVRIVSPADGWVHKASDNNVMPIEFNGYDLPNLQTITLQYAHADQGDWAIGGVILRNQITSTAGYTFNWNTSAIEDGEYDIRMRVVYNSCEGYTNRISGVIDREGPVLFGIPEPSDRTYATGDEISFSYSEEILAAAMNGNTVTMTRMLNGSNIPVQLSVSENKMMIIPTMSFSAFTTGESIRVVAKNISDLFGNVSAKSDSFCFKLGKPVTSATAKKVTLSNVFANKRSIFENSGDSIQIRFNLSSTSTFNTVVHFLVGGSADFESDYNPVFGSGQNLTASINAVQGRINIPANSNSAVLKIKPIGDFTPESNETVQIRLLGGGDYILGADSLTYIIDTIKNDDLSTPAISAGTLPLTPAAGYCAIQHDSSLTRTYVWDVPNTMPAGYCATTIDSGKVKPDVLGVSNIGESYALPTGYCAASSSYTGDEQIFEVSFGSLINLQTEDCSTNYSDYTYSLAPAVVSPGQSVSFSVRTDDCDGPGYYDNGMSIYIDYNRDGDFEDMGEQAYTTSQMTTSPNTRSGTIVIPTYAALGLTKMRVIVAEDLVSPGACDNFTYGEVEDYTVMITSVNTSAEPLFPEGYCEMGSDDSQIRILDTSVPDTLPGGYCAIVDNPSLARTDVVSAPSVGMSTMPSGYCTSYATQSADEQIFGVSFGSMNNTQVENCFTGYTDYSSSIAPVSVMTGATVPFSVVTDECDRETYYASGLSVFIDYNRDGDFDDQGEKAYTSNSTTLSPNTRDGNIIISETASVGLTKMRVVVAEGLYSPPPCQIFSWGEVEDYAIMISPSMPSSYCIPTGYSGADEQIFQVSVGSMNNIQTENCASSYTNYSTTVTAPKLKIGKSIPFSVITDECDGAPYYPSGMSIFIDYNKDGDFDDSTEQVYTSNGIAMSPNTRAGNFTVPADATPGYTMMRVIVIEQNYAPTPCASFNYGEAEDYAVVIDNTPGSNIYNDEQIFGFSFGSMFNYSQGDDCSANYKDYSAEIDPVEVYQGDHPSFSCYVNECDNGSYYPSGMSIFIDYDRDGIFNDDNEKVYTTNQTIMSPYQRFEMVSIPADATVGVTKMRVVVADGIASPGSCIPMGYGEVEDYSIRILSSAPPPSLVDDEQIFAVSFGTMNNTQSDYEDCSSNYSDYSSSILAPKVHKGQSVPFSVLTDECDGGPYYESGLTIFIDYNRDGDFEDADEKVYESAAVMESPNMRSGNIVIPAGAVSGFTKMRVIVNDGYVATEPCFDMGYGEVEDYGIYIDSLPYPTLMDDEQIFAVSFGTLNNVQSESCNSNYTDYSSTIAPTIVTVGQSVPFSVTTDECDNAPYFANGMSIFIDYNRDGDFTDEGEKVYTTSGTSISPNTRSGSIAIPANASLGLTKMRVVVAEGIASPGSCLAMGYGEVEDYAIKIHNVAPILTVFDDEQIKSVSFGTMNNAQTDNCGTNYSDYTNIPPPIVNLEESVPFSVVTNECDSAPYYATGMSIFIDYNRDGDFDDDGEKAYTTNAKTLSPNTRSGNIIIPANATQGITKMRVVVSESATSPGPCQPMGYGEVEDYLVMIRKILPATICQGGTTVLSAYDRIDGSPVFSYIWYYEGNSIATSRSITISSPGTYQLKVFNAGGFVGMSLPYVVTLTPPPVSHDYADVCPRELPYIWNGVNYTVSGNYSKTVSNALGCDSIANLHLNVRTNSFAIETVTAIDSFEWHGTLYDTSTNSPTWVGYNSIGCDSIVTLHLTVLPACKPIVKIINALSCSTYTWHGIRFTSSVTGVEWTSLNYRGCDSTEILNLTILPNSGSTTSASICPSQLPYLWNGISCTATGTYVKHFVNYLGCDSLAQLILTVKAASGSVNNLSICANELPYLWNGVTYTTAGSYSQTLVNSVGCDSIATIVLTLRPVSTTNTNLSICSNQLPFTWNGLIVNGAGSYSVSFRNIYGCDSLAILNLTVRQVSYSTETISATGTSYVWHGITYTASNHTDTWTGINAAGCDSVVTLDLTLTPNCYPVTKVYNVTACNSYIWHGIRSTTSTTLEWVGVTVDGCDSIEILNLTILNQTVSTTATPSTLTQTMLSNACGAKTYRYTASAVANATGYAWTLPASVGGVGGVFVDSGDASSSRIIVVRYTSDKAAFAADSVRVRSFNVCATSANKSAKLINALYSAPLAPASITITPISISTCGARRYRYIGPVLPAATTTAVAATGYLWSFGGVLGLNAVIDSGTINSQTITVVYSNNAAATNSDSVRLCFTTLTCGNSPNKSSKLTNTLLSAPAAPTVTVTPVVTNVCGARKYRYAASALLAATTSAGAAKGWMWSMPEGLVGTTGVIDSGDFNSQIIVVMYTSNAAAGAGDTIRVRFISDCGLGISKATKLTNAVLTVPAAPASITIVTASDICGARVYRYTAPALPAATTTTGAATGYLWAMPIGTLGSNGVLDSGTLSSKVIKIRYTSNSAAGTGDSIRLRYTSDCGNSLAKAQKLSNVAPAILAAPTTLSGTTSICSVVGTATALRYSCSSVTGAVSYNWILPSGAVLDSGATGIRIKVRFNTAGANDSIYVQARGSNGCLGNKKVLKLVTTGCVTPLYTKTTMTTPAANTYQQMDEVKIFPNPTSSAFNLSVISHLPPHAVHANIYDVNGRLVRKLYFTSIETVAFGNELIAGVYFVEIREGDKVKTIKVVKY